MHDHFVNIIIRQFVRNQPDIVIDKYSSTGAAGELYFGQRKILKDRVALKFYEIGALGINHNEPLLLKAITDDNILPIYDAKILNNKYAYYLTPEISGGDLQNYINHHIIDTETAFSITQGILKGLGTLQMSPNNFVHRDLKTLNILIDKHTKQAYISDFGTLKQIPVTSTHVTASKFTLLYKAPESIKSNQYFFQSDIYQVGIILYQVLGGNFSFNALDWLDHKQKAKFLSLSDIDKVPFINSIIENLILKGKILDYNSLPAYVDAKLKKIITKATNKDYNKRYSTCSEFLKDIFDYQKNSKNWWTDGIAIYATNKKKSKHYLIEELKGNFLLKISTDGINWRNKNLPKKDKSSVIDFVANDK